MFFILRAAEGTPGRCLVRSCRRVRQGVRRGDCRSCRTARAPPSFFRFSPWLSACFAVFCRRPFADPDRFRFPFLPPFFLSAFVPASPLPRFPAFPLQIRSVFAGKNNGAEPYFRLRPAEMMSFFSFFVPLFTPPREKSPSAGRRVSDSRLLPCVGIVL